MGKTNGGKEGVEGKSSKIRDTANEKKTEKDSKSWTKHSKEGDQSGSCSLQ